MIAAFGLIGAIIATTSLHLHVSYKFGVLGESWTRKRVQRATYVVFVILIGCLIGKKRMEIDSKDFSFLLETNPIKHRVQINLQTKTKQNFWFLPHNLEKSERESL